MRVQDILRTKGAKLSAISPDASIREAAPSSLQLKRLEHDPEKWTPVFGRRSCSNKKPKRDDDFEEKSSRFNEARTEWQRRKSALPFSPFRQHCTLSGAAQNIASRPRTGIISKSRLSQSMALPHGNLNLRR